MLAIGNGEGAHCPRQFTGRPGSQGCAGRRYPTLPVAELQRHQAPVNALAWAPHSSCHICSAGDDAQALIWDLSTMSHPMDHGLGAARCPSPSMRTTPCKHRLCSSVTAASG